MKTRLIRLFFVCLFFSAGHMLFAQQQNAYTYYNNLGFAIKKTYSLERNTNFLNTARRIKNGPKILDAFVCAQNIEKNDPDQINIINIHVTEESNAAESLRTYKQDLSSQNISYKVRTLNGLTGVEYTFKQDMGTVMLPTKAFWGYKGNKFYLIQLASLTNCSTKFETLLNSIKIL